MINLSVNKPDATKIYERGVGCYGIIINNLNEVVLVKSNNQYFLPGGGIEKSESLIDCLERECFEEMGTKITDIKEFASVNYFFYSTRF